MSFPPPLPAPFSRRALLLGGLALALAPRRAAAGKPVVLVILSDRSERTLAIAEAFKAQAEFAIRMTYDLSDETDGAAAMADQIREMSVGFVLAVGDKAGRATAREFAGVPGACVDVTDEGVRAASQLTTIEGRVSPGLVLDRLAILRPGLKRLGVLRANDPADAYWAAIDSAAAERGVKVTHAALAGQADARNAFLRVQPQSDFVWLQPAPTVWTGSALATVFQEAAMLHTPIAGFARAHLTSPSPPTVVVEASTSGLGELAAAHARTVLLGEAAKTAAYIPPIIVGHLTGIRTAQLPPTRQALESLDELVR